MNSLQELPEAEATTLHSESSCAGGHSFEQGYIEILPKSPLARRQSSWELIDGVSDDSASQSFSGAAASPRRPTTHSPPESPAHAQPIAATGKDVEKENEPAHDHANSKNNTVPPHSSFKDHLTAAPALSSPAAPRPPASIPDTASLTQSQLNTDSTDAPHMPTARKTDGTPVHYEAAQAASSSSTAYTGTQPATSPPSPPPSSGKPQCGAPRSSRWTLTLENALVVCVALLAGAALLTAHTRVQLVDATARGAKLQAELRAARAELAECADARVEAAASVAAIAERHRALHRQLTDLMRVEPVCKRAWYRSPHARDVASNVDAMLVQSMLESQQVADRAHGHAWSRRLLRALSKFVIDFRIFIIFVTILACGVMYGRPTADPPRVPRRRWRR